MPKSLEEIFETNTQEKDVIQDKHSLSDIFSETQEIQEPEIKNNSNFINAGIMGGLAAGTGLAGKAAFDYWKRPQKLLVPVERELSEMTKIIPSMKGMHYQDIPGRIINQMAEQRLQIKDFDDLTLSTSAEDLASSVKTAYPKLRQHNFKAYGQALTEGENIIAKSGKQLNTLQFDEDVIAKTLKNLENRLPEEELTALKPMLRDAAKGEQKISLSSAKKYLETIRKKLPSEGQRTINKNWGKFLEKNAPPEVAKSLSQANLKYSDFLEQDAALRKLIDPKTGDYDYDKLYCYTLQRAKTKINSDFKKLMSGLSEIEPEVGTKAQKLYTLRTKRINMQRGLNSLKAWATKAGELVSQRTALLEKYPHRLKGAGKILGSIGKTAARAAIFKGMPMIATGALDPSSMLLEKEFGTSDPLEIIGRALGNRKTSEEEFRKWQEANMI